MKKRPVYLDLTKISMPLTATISIIHRISGVLLFVSIGILLYLLNYSLTSQTHFIQLKSCVNSFGMFIILFGIGIAFSLHICAGIRHLIQDAGLFEDFNSATKTAKIALISAGILSLIIGVILW